MGVCLLNAIHHVSVVGCDGIASNSQFVHTHTHTHSNTHTLPLGVFFSAETSSLN